MIFGNFLIEISAGKFSSTSYPGYRLNNFPVIEKIFEIRGFIRLLSRFIAYGLAKPRAVRQILFA